MQASRGGQECARSRVGERARVVEARVDRDTRPARESSGLTGRPPRDLGGRVESARHRARGGRGRTASSTGGACARSRRAGGAHGRAGARARARLARVGQVSERSADGGARRQRLHDRGRGEDDQDARRVQRGQGARGRPRPRAQTATRQTARL